MAYAIPQCCQMETQKHHTISTMEAYGKEKIIENEECINHVCKRMGTPLQNLISEAKAQKKPSGGRGNLTKETMTKSKISMEELSRTILRILP